MFLRGRVSRVYFKAPCHGLAVVSQIQILLGVYSIFGYSKTAIVSHYYAWVFKPKADCMMVADAELGVISQLNG